MSKEEARNEKILEYLATINKKREEIEKIERPNWKTNCAFSADGLVKNLHVENDVRTLVIIASIIMTKEDAYYKARLALGIDNVPDFEFNGYSLKDWLCDIKSRINKVQVATKKKELQELEDRLNKIVSPELRAEMELLAIAKELGK